MSWKYLWSYSLGRCVTYQRSTSHLSLYLGYLWERARTRWAAKIYIPLTRFHINQQPIRHVINVFSYHWSHVEIYKSLNSLVCQEEMLDLTNLGKAAPVWSWFFKLVCTTTPYPRHGSPSSTRWSCKDDLNSPWPDFMPATGWVYQPAASLTWENMSFLTTKAQRPIHPLRSYVTACSVIISNSVTSPHKSLDSRSNQPELLRPHWNVASAWNLFSLEAILTSTLAPPPHVRWPERHHAAETCMLHEERVCSAL